MQELMYVAARIVKTSRSIKLSFGKGCRALLAYRSVYKKTGVWIATFHGKPVRFGKLGVGVVRFMQVVIVRNYCAQLRTVKDAATCKTVGVAPCQ